MWKYALDFRHHVGCANVFVFVMIDKMCVPCANSRLHFEPSVMRTKSVIHNQHSVGTLWITSMRQPSKKLSSAIENDQKNDIALNRLIYFSNICSLIEILLHLYSLLKALKFCLLILLLTMQFCFKYYPHVRYVLENRHIICSHDLLKFLYYL